MTFVNVSSYLSIMKTGANTRPLICSLGRAGSLLSSPLETRQCAPPQNRGRGTSLFLILFCITNLCMPLELSIHCHTQITSQLSFVIVNETQGRHESLHWFGSHGFSWFSLIRLDAQRKVLLGCRKLGFLTFR
jgi:hypothetical protein